MSEKWIDYTTAKKLLENVCNFLKKDKSKIADFIIPPKEAVVLLFIQMLSFLSIKTIE